VKAPLKRNSVYSTNTSAYKILANPRLAKLISDIATPPVTDSCWRRSYFASVNNTKTHFL